MKSVSVIRVCFTFDTDAGVFVAWSDDVPLATEAPTFEALREKVQGMIPDLLELNDITVDHDAPEVPLELLLRENVALRRSC